MNTRNKPCPCGSGKKHKKCCGNEAMLTAKREAAWKEWREKREKERLKRLEELASMPASQRHQTIKFGQSAILAAMIAGSLQNQKH